MKRTYLIILTIILTKALLAQNNLTKKLDELMTIYADNNLFNGSVLIEKDGKILLNKGYGYSDVSKKTMNTTDSKYQIYSITKSITATLILKLSEENKLSLKDKLSKFYPSFPMGNSITIENLLTHTSGIYNYNNDFSMPVDSEKSMLNFLQKEPLDFLPGTDWNYSNTGYFLLGFIVKKVTGLSYETAVKKYIFEPLKMTNSGFNYKALADNKKTTGYTILYNDTSNVAPLYDENELFSAGGIYSTTGDLNKFHQAMQTNRIINKDLTSKAYTPFKNNYGYGWFIDSISGKKIVSHSGGASGFRSNLIRVPEDNICIILLCNSENSDVTATKKKLLSILFNQPYKLPPRINISRDEVKEMQGTYSVAPSFAIYVSAKNGRLTARPTMQSETLLLPEKENIFYIDAIDGYIEFKKSNKGFYDTLVLTQNGESYTGVRIYPGWGVVGSSTKNGWNGPDLKLVEDDTKKGIWSLNNIALTEGEIKFRFNNDWTFNYGLDKNNNGLKAEGQNIKIETGMYDILLDLRNSNEPKFTIKKLN
jgi:CubicO group peptidase (beta-lactamase class C family)